MGKISERLQRKYNEAKGIRAEPATKDDLHQLRKELDNNLRKQSSARQSGAEAFGHAAKMAKKGFADIGRSLNKPYDTRRPKISQMPQRRKDIGISVGIDLDYLKHPTFRGKDLRGRKTK